MNVKYYMEMIEKFLRDIDTKPDDFMQIGISIIRQGDLTHSFVFDGEVEQESSLTKVKKND